MTNKVIREQTWKIEARGDTYYIVAPTIEEAIKIYRDISSLEILNVIQYVQVIRPSTKTITIDV